MPVTTRGNGITDDKAQHYGSTYEIRSSDMKNTEAALFSSGQQRSEAEQAAALPALAGGCGCEIAGAPCPSVAGVLSLARVLDTALVAVTATSF